MDCSQLEAELENLPGSGYEKYPISPETPLCPLGYNCIAYAAGHTDSPPGEMQRPWWPHPDKTLYYWPPHLEREPEGAETPENFLLAFEWKGYVRCTKRNNNASHKKGIEKVAIYLVNGIPKHAARQLESGRWTSKCGDLQDIQHDYLEAVEGKWYGKATVFLRRGTNGRPLQRDKIRLFFKRLFK